jgi:crotonobetainyl-CoA:carnitine CoA-transferase CaiB-like acyl-CoA transferase
MLPPGSNNSFEYRMDDIPAVGQHTEAILSELGIAASEIELMRSQGAI